MKSSVKNSIIYFVRILILVIMISAAGISKTAVCHADETWTINGVTLPLDEDGYRLDDYTGPGKCWEFANHVYYRIWHRVFSQDPGSDDDMLRDYPHGEARRITAENARTLISFAPVGSVVRLQLVEEGPDNTKSASRHSLILLDKTETGCTFYHLWKGVAAITTYTWEEFEEQYRTETDFGYIKYIKYPGAETVDASYEGPEMEKELVVSSKIYGSVEITENKRDTKN